MKEEFVDLYTLQKDLKDGLEGLFPDKLWVKAEIASIGVKSGGHCYMDLVQSQGGNVVAKVHAIIWRSYYNLLSAKYKSETGKAISAGVEVLLRVEVSFHEVYGLSLIADDIAPLSQQGGQSLKRAQTIEQLTREGLLDKQKALQMTDLPYNLAVISAEGAAGFGDFRRHLLQNEFGYAYNMVLFPATLQGDGAPSSIILALNQVLLSSTKFDVVLLLRGGGSETDLLCFDDYSLSAAIAHSPIPVITAIGHDKDFHIADMVAYKYVKTPTALADLFINLTAVADERISLYANRLSLAFQNRLSALEGRLVLLEHTISAGYRSKFATAESSLQLLEQKIGALYSSKFAGEQASLSLLEQKIIAQSRAKFTIAQGRLALLEAKIAATDPRAVLGRGFSLTLNARGQKLTSAQGLSSGEKISVLFADGRLDATVDSVDLTAN